MGKLDELRRSATSNIDESMGAWRAGGTAGIPRELPGAPRSAPTRLQGIARTTNAAEIPLEKIVPDPDQPREEFAAEALDRLSDSLRTRGQLQPIRVRWVEDAGRYMIVCGERRWRAAELAGLKTMSCVIMDAPVTRSELLSLQIVENMLREDLAPMEQAKGFRALMETNGWSGAQLADALGIAQPTVVKALSLLKLSPAVQEQVEQGNIAPATAYELSRVDDPETQRNLADRVISEGMSRAEAVEVVKLLAGRDKGRAGKPRAKGNATKSPRLPAEVRHRDPNGCKVIVHTTAKHAIGDVVVALRAFADRLQAAREDGAEEAA
jgi:ParB family transcriptional regulator, chromosome partitioning protein